MDRSDIGRIVEDARLNAALGWILVALVLVAAGVNLANGDRLWAGFALCVALVAVVPALFLRSPRSMLPWEVLVLAAFPLLARPFGGPGVSDVATYLSVAAIALLVAVELHVFTPVEMTHSFAVFFVVVATMATAGIWAVVRWTADIYLGTGFALDERALMLEFVASTVAGVGAGVVFEFYFRRYVHGEERLEVEL
ncbi:hypothetical protein [Halomarina litorea]|uniref:hypothetical protein n=1 Tax=Halomarina litorea TaxID=2961595 RepID=UPI0020C3D976|nr:hypothetical protein [Halomarina sp. BCD28]